MTVCIDNPIPLGRGMGSSGSAVVAGVALANESLQLNLSKQQMLDLCCVVEGHPDNIAPSLLGGLVASYIRSPLEPYTSAHYLPNTLLTPPDSMTYSRCLKMNPQIKAVVIVPDFQVKTTDARNALPETYTRADVVFNLSRAAVLTHELCSDSLEATIISEAMQDQIHQPYREILVPGLQEALAIKPDSIGGLLGVCLSGAGPSILALATHGFDDIGITISQILQRYIHEGSHIESFYHVLDIDTVGLVVEHFSSN